MHLNSTVPVNTFIFQLDTILRISLKFVFIQNCVKKVHKSFVHLFKIMKKSAYDFCESIQNCAKKVNKNFDLILSKVFRNSIKGFREYIPKNVEIVQNCLVNLVNYVEKLQMNSFNLFRIV